MIKYTHIIPHLQGYHMRTRIQQGACVLKSTSFQVAEILTSLVRLAVRCLLLLWPKSCIPPRGNPSGECRLGWNNEKVKLLGYVDRRNRQTVGG